MNIWTICIIGGSIFFRMIDVRCYIVVLGKEDLFRVMDFSKIVEKFMDVGLGFIL